jgi:hypothetical protein
MKFFSKSLIATTAIAAGIAGTAVPASAAVLVHAFRSDFQVFAANFSLELKNNGNRVINFDVAEKGIVVITYSAACAVNAAAGNFSATVNLDILIDGNPVPPNNTAFDPYCSSNGTAGFDEIGVHTIVIAKKLQPGAHTVEIDGTLGGGATGAAIGNATLTIHN